MSPVHAQDAHVCSIRAQFHEDHQNRDQPAGVHDGRTAGTDNSGAATHSYPLGRPPAMPVFVFRCGGGGIAAAHWASSIARPSRMIRPLARRCTQLSGSCLDGEARVGRAARLHGGGCSGASESSARLDGQQRLSGSAAYEDQRARAPMIDVCAW